MNPLRWKREHQIAFLAAAAVGAGIGVFAGVRQIDPSANFYWLAVGEWAGAGALTGAVGALIRQLLRGRNLN